MEITKRARSIFFRHFGISNILATFAEAN